MQPFGTGFFFFFTWHNSRDTSKMYIELFLMVNFFNLLICHTYILFGEMSLHVFCPISNWTVFLEMNFESSLHILNISVLLYIFVICK